jgi:hypothetical protein
MSTNIYDYSALNAFSVLSGSGGISTAVGTEVVAINNGKYGTSGSVTVGAGSSITGTQESNASIVTLALAQLASFIAAVGLLPTTSTTSLTSAVSNTITPGKYAYATPAVSLAASTILNFDAQNNPNAQFFLIGSTLSMTTVTINLINGASPCNIFWIFSALITITTPVNNVSGIFMGSLGITISLSTNPTFNGRLYDQTVAIQFLATSGTSTVNGPNCPQNIICYAKGTLILTKQGFVPIENIKAGHNVVTKGKIYNNKYITNSNVKVEPVMWVSKFKVHDLNSKSRPICIEKDALSENCPFKNLYVSPNHSLLLNGNMVLAKNMVNGKNIYQDNECDEVEYYHLECEYHRAIVANGVLSESYFDVNGNREVFDNSVKLRRTIDLKKLRNV